MMLIYDMMMKEGRNDQQNISKLWGTSKFMFYETNLKIKLSER